MYGFPADYLSEEMFEAIGWAVDEAKKHGMRFWIYDEYNWPSGAAGGYLIRSAGLGQGLCSQPTNPAYVVAESTRAYNPR